MSVQILALDLSLSSTGYCRAAADNPRFYITALGSVKTVLQTSHVSGGTKVIDQQFTLQQRIEQILRRLDDVGLRSPETVQVGIENYAFRAAGDSMSKLVELQGVIRFLLHGASIPWMPITIQTIKAHATQGAAGKNIVAMHARIQFADAILQWGRELENDDQADALVLCHLTWLYYRWTRNLPIEGYELTKKVIDRLKALQKAHS